MSLLRLSFLGPPEVKIDHQPVTLPTRKSIALLAYLSVTGKPHPRDSLAALFWPELDQSRARASLRHALWTLGSAGLANWLETEQELVRLKPGYDLDVAAFQKKIARSQNHGHTVDLGCPECTNQLIEAANLYRDDFLAGFSLRDSPEFDDWQLYQTESLRQDLAGAFERLVSLYSAVGEWEKAIPHARRWVILDALHEPAHRALMQVYVQAGKRGLALKQYETLCQTLERELGVEPDAESQTLYKNILSGRIQAKVDESLKSHPPPLGDHRMQNLPLPMTSLVGRQREIAEIKDHLQASSANKRTFRLLTLTGPVGVGKTRLALEVARELLEAYPAGVWFVELAGVRDPALVPKMVAFSLGVQEQPGREITETILFYLRSRRLLLLLDNCEHLVEACADLSITLLKHCPELQILATSRQTLGISGEWTWLVPGLSLPPATESALPGVEPNLYPESLLSMSEAVQLFVERARLIQLHFALTQQNAAAVTQICRSLDGIPLAIELAAARLNILSPKEIAIRLQNRFQLLRTKYHGVSERHQTMLAAVDWSYGLLSESERLLFNRLSVFNSGFTLEAVEEVCAGRSASQHAKFALQPKMILDLLSSLFEKSMIVAELNAQGTVRYRLLETLCHYGGERLAESGETEAIRQRHAEYYLAFAEKAEPGFRSHEHAAWFSQVVTEHDNLRAALQWAFSHADLRRDPHAVEIGVRLAQALWWFWYVHGYWSEGRDWYTKCLTLPLERLPPLVQVRAYIYASLFTISPGDLDRALQLTDQGLSLARQLGDEEGIAISLLRKGRLIGRKDPSLGTSLLEESLNIFRRLGDPFFIGTAHYYLSYHLGWTFLNSGDFTQATQWLQESLALAEALGSDLGMAITYSTLGQLARIQGDFEHSLSLFAKGLAICRQYGEDYQASATLASILYGHGQLAFAQGNHAQAIANQRDALELQCRWGMFTEMATSLEALAIVFAADQNSEKAVRLFAAAEAYRQLKGYPLPQINQAEHEHWLAHTRVNFNELAFAEAWAEGQAMTLEEAMDYALKAAE